MIRRGSELQILNFETKFLPVKFQRLMHFEAFQIKSFNAFQNVLKSKFCMNSTGRTQWNH